MEEEFEMEEEEEQEEELLEEEALEEEALEEEAQEEEAMPTKNEEIEEYYPAEVHTPKETEPEIKKEESKSVGKEKRDKEKRDKEKRDKEKRDKEKRDKTKGDKKPKPTQYDVGEEEEETIWEVESEDIKSVTTSETHLFLVEFLVDCVVIDCCAVEDEILEGQTCLSLNFLNFPPMDICEKDFDPNKEGGYDRIRFNSGKSLMFAFNRRQCDRPPPLLLEITVYKKLNYDETECKIEIGTTKICISEIFRQIVDIAKFTPDKLPSSKAIKDCFMLIGSGKRTTGEVSVYVRLSCLGQNVVTEFQCGSDLQKSPVLFKSREGKKIYEFMGNEIDEESDACQNEKFASQNHFCRNGQGDMKRCSPSAGKVFTEGNRVVLDIPDKSNRCRGEHNVDRCKVSNQSGDYKVTQDSLMDKSRTKDGLTVSQLNSDPDQNYFILKVGDKGQIPDRGKMILEFRTPKQKILPKILPPYHEDIAVQTETAKKRKKGKQKKKK